MGYHYVPRFYLNGFAPNGAIWTHDRDERRSFLSQPKSIANETDMYPDEVEKYLASQIENPAKPGIEKIRSGALLDEGERLAVASYVIAMWKRVPEARSRVSKRMPEVAASVRDNLHQELDAAVRTRPDFAESAESKKRQVNEIIARYERDPPPDIWHKSLATESTPRVIDSLQTMNWRFLISEREQFLTCDNPVFFFQDEGIGKPYSELSIPFSSNITLWANRRDTPTQTFIHAKPSVVRELNRRMAFNATRFVYSERNERWILPFICKEGHLCNHIE